MEKMNYYEIIGPSGSGKTALFNHLRQRNIQFRNKYFSILPYLINSNRLDAPKSIVFKFLASIFPVKTFERLKSRLYQVSREHQELLLNDYGYLYLVLLNGIKKENPVYINQVLNDYLSTLMTIHLMDLSLSENEFVIVDEGVIHKNSALRNVHYLDDIIDRLKTFVKGVIYLNVPDDQVFEQSLKRLHLGHKTLSHKFLDQDLLRIKCNKEIKSYKEFVDKLRTLNIPVLEIRDINSLNQVEMEINLFISK